MVITKDSFLDLLEKNNLKAFEVVPNTKLTVQLNCSIEDFLQIVSSKHSDIFYFFDYPEDHEILITGETFANANRQLQKMFDLLGIDEDFTLYIDKCVYPDLYSDDEEGPVIRTFSSLEKQLQKDIFDYNSHANKKDLIVPYRFMSFYVDGGCLIGIYSENPKPTWSVAEEKLYDILCKYQSIIEEQAEAAEQRKLVVREKLKAFLVDDMQFKISTNKKLRVEYARNLWYDKQFKWMHEGFAERGNSFPSNEYFNYIERVFKEMKYIKTH